MCAHGSPALIRPGRVDRRVHLGLASASSARALFARFYHGSCADEAELERLADAVACRIPDGTLSMATIQGHLMKYAASPVEAHAHLDELLCAP